jgi:hypothetical protein
MHFFKTFQVILHVHTLAQQCLHADNTCEEVYFGGIRLGYVRLS